MAEQTFQDPPWLSDKAFMGLQRGPCSWALGGCLEPRNHTGQAWQARDW